MRLLVAIEAPDVDRSSGRSDQFWRNKLAASLRLIAERVQVGGGDGEFDHDGVFASFKIEWPDAADAA